MLAYCVYTSIIISLSLSLSQDYEGQRVAERCYQYVIVLFAVSYNHVPTHVAACNSPMSFYRRWGLFGDTFASSMFRLCTYYLQALHWLAW